MTITALLASHTSGPPDNWLYHYQTLVIGMLTPASAIAAAPLLHHQTRQSSAIAANTNAGQRQAARSWLSLHLSWIIEYAEETGKGVWKLVQACDERGQLPADTVMPNFPSVPMDAAIAVKEFSEFARPEEAKYIALMFATMQVLHARLGALKKSRKSGRNVLNLEAYLKDAAELYARSEALLNYARHKSDAFPKGVTWSDMKPHFLVLH